MSLLHNRYLTKRWIRAYFDGTEGGEGGAAGAGAGEGGAAGAGAGAAGKTFTQADVDRIIGERLKTVKTEKEQTLAKLTKLQETANLTAAEKEELAGQITSLQESLQTKEQQTQSEIKKWQTKYETDVKKHQTEAEQWKNRFTTTVVERSILDSAITSDALEPSQFVMMFGNQARLTDVLGDDGKPTGEHQVKLKFKAPNDEKKLVDFDLPIAEAIALMREKGLHKNLFGTTGTGGTGTETNGGSRKSASDADAEPDRENFNSDAEYNTAYQKWRNKFDAAGNKLTK